MKAKASVIAQKLLNLYRQAHVIEGGWAMVNRVFVNEATDDVLTQMQDLPTGKFLIEHIKNLRSGKTPMNAIARELLPYGGMLAENVVDVDVGKNDLQELIDAIDNFNPTQDGIDTFLNNPVIKNAGQDWIKTVHKLISGDADATKKFDQIVRTWTAYNMWTRANDVLAAPVDDRVRAQLQVDMPEYETYLPMFGDEGQDLLRRLHKLTSALPHKQ